MTLHTKAAEIAAAGLTWKDREALERLLRGEPVTRQEHLTFFNAGLMFRGKITDLGRAVAHQLAGEKMDCRGEEG